MPGKIKVLEPDVANKIAAGEVIERPSSVVKELVENSIDAGAKNITIEVKGLPWEYIKVQDDGEGMSSDDALLAFERHATSKISTAEELFRILTLGFRGEALPSIASVSRLTLVTRAPGEPGAFSVEYEGGVRGPFGPASGPVGTAVTVRELFFNTPARFKYLKKPATEMAHIYATAVHLALAHPEVAFKVYHDGRRVMLTQGDGDYLETIRGVVGAEVAKKLVKIAGGSEGVRLLGYIGRPEDFRAGRDMEYLFVNGRPVRSKVVISALEKAYERLIPRSRYPIVFIWLRVEPGSIDVNIHPAKKEVRFLNEGEVYRLISSCVRQGLSSFEAIPHIPPPRPREQKEPRGLQYSFNLPEPQVQDVAGVREEGLPYGESHPERPADLPIEVLDGGDSRGLALRPIAQFLSSYILAESGEELVIIDQHAAHERVIYERLMEGVQSGALGAGSQELLLPPTLEFPPQMSILVQQNLELMAGMGFVMEPFGQNAFRLRSIPQAISGAWDDLMLSEFEASLAMLLEDGRPELNLGKLTCGLACKAAVKAGESLPVEGMKRLLLDLVRCKEPLTCPHGRPTMIRITKDYLDGSFRRK